MTCLTHFSQQRVQRRSIITYTLFTFVFIAVVGLLAFPVLASEGKGHHKHTPEKKLDKLTKKLSLTDEQRAAILPILKEKRQKMEALHDQMKEVRQNAMAQIKAQLTPEQQEKFQMAREKHQKKMKEYREGHHQRGKHGKKHKKHKRDQGNGDDEDDDSHDDDYEEEDEHDDDDDNHGKKGKNGKRGKGRH